MAPRQSPWRLRALVVAIGAALLLASFSGRIRKQAGETAAVTAAPVAAVVSGHPLVTNDGEAHNYVAAPSDLHSFLVSKMPEGRTAEYYTTDVRPYWRANDTDLSKLASEPSQYLEQIKADLAPWLRDGIKKELVDAAAQYADVCASPVVRVQVINGSVWISEQQPPEPERPSHALQLESILLNVLDVVSTFPGSIKDLDFALTAAEAPCVRTKWAHGSTPVPLFGRTGSRRHRDVPLPESDLWLPGRSIPSPFGDPIIGWDRIAELLDQTYGVVPLTKRLPSIAWRGRLGAWDGHPERDEQKKALLRCPRELIEAGQPFEASLFNTGPWPEASLSTLCEYRHLAHVEGQSASDDLRLKFMCRAVVVATEFEYWEYWQRGLQAGKHLVVTTQEHDHVCEMTARAVRDLNSLIGQVGVEALRDYNPQIPPPLAAHLEAMRNDKTLEPTTHSNGEDDSPLVDQKLGTYAWGTDRMPWDMAWEGKEYVAKKARAIDTLLYARDALAQYGEAMAYEVTPVEKAHCLSGPKLLERIGALDATERGLLEKAHPWIATLDGNCEWAERTFANAKH